MARCTGADCRECRREGCKLFLKGERCTTKKCAMERRPVAPGQHGASRKKVTEYGTQLREKQKVKKAYGILEKQFRRYYDEDDENKNNNRYLIKEINYNGEEMEVNKQTIAVLKGEISTEDAFRVEFEKDENSGRIYRVVISKK